MLLLVQSTFSRQRLAALRSQKNLTTYSKESSSVDEVDAESVQDQAAEHKIRKCSLAADLALAILLLHKLARDTVHRLC